MKRPKKRKPRPPYFVKITLLPNGVAELTDDSGEIFHLQMHRGRAWPILSRQMRRFELFENGERREHPKPPRPSGPPKLTICK